MSDPVLNSRGMDRYQFAAWAHNRWILWSEIVTSYHSPTLFMGWEDPKDLSDDSFNCKRGGASSRDRASIGNTVGFWMDYNHFIRTKAENSACPVEATGISSPSEFIAWANQGEIWIYSGDSYNGPYSLERIEATTSSEIRVFMRDLPSRQDSNWTIKFPISDSPMFSHRPNFVGMVSDFPPPSKQRTDKRMDKDRFCVWAQENTIAWAEKGTENEDDPTIEFVQWADYDSGEFSAMDEDGAMSDGWLFYDSVGYGDDGGYWYLKDPSKLCLRSLKNARAHLGQNANNPTHFTIPARMQEDAKNLGMHLHTQVHDELMFKDDLSDGKTKAELFTDEFLASFKTPTIVSGSFTNAASNEGILRIALAQAEHALAQAEQERDELLVALQALQEKYDKLLLRGVKLPHKRRLKKGG